MLVNRSQRSYMRCGPIVHANTTHHSRSVNSPMQSTTRHLRLVRSMRRPIPRSLSRYAVLRISVLVILFMQIVFFGVQAGASQVTGTLRALTYTVQPGDSLWSIARRFDTHVADLRVLNDCKTDLIRPGQILFVPRLVYTVCPGDCLYTIATTYGTTVRDLMEANNLETDLLRAGQTLLLPSYIKPRISKVSPDGLLRRSVSEEEFDLLVRLVHAEAGGESYIGKVAVAASVLNRVDSPHYPNTIKDVVYQVIGDNGYQYTPVANGRINQPGDAESARAVEAALAGWDPTGGATGFYNPRATSDRWVRSRKEVAVIGNHVFFI